MTESGRSEDVGRDDEIVVADSVRHALGRARDWPGRVFSAWRDRRREVGEQRRRLAGAPGPRVAGLPVPVWLALVLLLGLGVRIYYFVLQAGFHYPDELFQYLEPAYWRRNGFAWLPWEFDRGARNWLLVFHYGALMEIGDVLGFSGRGMYRFLWFHNVVVSLAIVPAGYRIGVATGRGDHRLGVLVAGAFAVFPTLAYFAPHTLSEWHGLLFTTWAYALWLEQVEKARTRGQSGGGSGKAFVVGLLLGGGFIARYTNVLWLPLILLDYNFRARFRQLAAVIAGLAAAIALLGFVDALTWGRPFHSIIEYFQFNYVEGGAANLEVKTADYYWRMLFELRLGPARWVLLAGVIFGLRRHWRLVLGWLLPFLALSRVGIKQERFLLSMWPLLLAAGVAGLVAASDLVGRLRGVRRRALLERARPAVLGALLVAIVASSFAGAASYRMRWKGGVFLAQEYIGEQPDATGVLIDDRIHLNGGYTILDRNIPQTQYGGVPRQRIFNYIAVYREHSIRTLDRRDDFERVADFEGVVVFRRTDGLAGR